MGNMSVQTDGGAHIGGNVDIRGGSFVGRDQINYHYHFGSLAGFSSELVKQVRDRVQQGDRTNLLTPVEPLCYYAWRRPMASRSSYVKEVEVWIALISKTPEPIEIVEIHFPDAINDVELLTKWSCELKQISAFGILPVMRYVVTAETWLKHQQVLLSPKVIYHVSGEVETRQLSARYTDERDVTRLFVPFINQKHVRDEIQQCLNNPYNETTIYWFSITDKWGKGRSRTLTECTALAESKGFDVLKSTHLLKKEGEISLDPFHIALCNRIGCQGNLEDIMARLITWIEPTAHSKPVDDYTLGLVLEYLLYETSQIENLNAVVNCVLQRAHTTPLFIALDDLHEASDCTKTILQHLAEKSQDEAESIPGIQLVVCVTYDSQEYTLPPWPVCKKLQLEELKEADVLMFVQTLFPEIDIPPDCKESLLNFLGERPWLVRYGLNSLRTEGYIELENGHWHLNHGFDKGLDTTAPQSPSKDQEIEWLLMQHTRRWESSGKTFIP